MPPRTPSPRPVRRAPSTSWDDPASGHGGGAGGRSCRRRRLLALGVRERWGLAALPELARAPGGKPFFPAFPQYRFNLTHTDGLCLCALSEAEVGVDAERVRPAGPGCPAMS